MSGAGGSWLTRPPGVRIPKPALAHRKINRLLAGRKLGPQLPSPLISRFQRESERRLSEEPGRPTNGGPRRLPVSVAEASSDAPSESPARRSRARNVEVGGRGGRVEAASDGPRPRGPGRVAVHPHRAAAERALGPSVGHCKVSLSSHTLRTLQSAKSILYNAVIRRERCRLLEIVASGRGRL
jgi:hypothetical protein